MKFDILENFQKSKNTDKNVCFLHSAQRGISILAKNPVDEFKGNDPQKFLNFTKKNKKNILIGYISYDLAYKLYNIKPKAKNDLQLPIINFFAFNKWKETKSPKFHKKLTTEKLKEKINFEIKISKGEYKKPFKR
jgi:hypothetical protein